MATRITKNVERSDHLTLTINGNVVSAFSGETLATILFAENIHTFYKTGSNQSRSPFCNMGTCFECQVKVERANTDNPPNWVRACMTQAEEGMIVTTGTKLPSMETEYDNG